MSSEPTPVALRGTRVLVISAHFDDEVIGCGGTLLHHRDTGDRIKLVYLSAGDSGDTKRGSTGAETAAVRTAEAAAVTKRLHADPLECLQRREGFLTDGIRLRRQLVSLIRDFRPSVVYAPHIDEGHPDHRVAGLLARRCVPLAGYPHFPELGDRHRVDIIRYYEVWTPMRQPTLYVDIGPQREAKSELLRLYESQLAIRNYVDAAEGLNAFRGRMGAGCEAAEAFLEQRVRPAVLRGPTVAEPWR